MKKVLSFLVVLLFCSGTSAQQAVYDVSAGNGNGIRFWASDFYKIHMGNTSEYLYGPVNSYSVKMNMGGGEVGRGWTWGGTGQTPVAALNTLGQMKIAGAFESNGNISTSRPSRGYLALTGDLPGYANGEYPTLKTDYKFLYFSAAGKYSVFIGETNPIFGVNDATGNPKILLNSTGSSYLNGGSIGIGTNSPQAKLEVVGPSTGSGPTIRASGGGDVVLNSGGSLFLDGNYSYASGSYIRPSGGTNTQGFYTSGQQRMRINADGKIGIGTGSPDQLLTVNGKIHSQEVIVDLAVPAPDYVFEKSYDLKSLEEVKTYIDENKHLPDVPSAKEMENDGVKVGEMEMILLKKIEELTLYLLSQQAMIQKQQKEIEMLKSTLKN